MTSLTSANTPDSDRPEPSLPTHAAQLRRALTGYLTIIGWLPLYPRQWLHADLLAGMTLVALAVPESPGYAQIAGAPVQLGLNALFDGLIGYAVFGSSGQVVVGLSAVLAAISAVVISDLAPGVEMKRLRGHSQGAGVAHQALAAVARDGAGRGISDRWCGTQIGGFASAMGRPSCI